jgi:hypothetical protein
MEPDHSLKMESNKNKKQKPTELPGGLFICACFIVLNAAVSFLVPAAGAGHPGQDRNTDKYDDRDHDVDGTHLGNYQGPGQASNYKSKTDEIYY